MDLRVVTESGSVYVLTYPGKARTAWIAKKDGQKAAHAVAIFPDRLPFVLAATRIEHGDETVAGYNKDGVRTFFFIKHKLMKGMILMNRQGFRSTPIVSIERL
jgi:hypothetical protein